MPETPVHVIFDGRYALFELVGTGQFGEVWRARDNLQDVPVAVKLLADEVELGAALLETRILTRLREQERIITIRNVVLAPPRPFIVMDYLPAGSVEQRLKMGVVSMVNAVDWVCQALDGLAFAHAEGVIHRDIKPSNLLLDDQQRAVLSDFGIAEDTVNHLLAVPDTYVAHQAPEAAATGSSRATDIWAVGCTLYRLLTGDYPFATAADAAAGRFQAPHKLNPQVPMSVTRVLQKALAVDPAARYPDAGKMLKALLALPVTHSWSRMSDVDAVERWEASTPEGDFVLRICELPRAALEVSVTRDKGSGPRRCFHERCATPAQVERIRRNLLLKLVQSGAVL